MSIKRFKNVGELVAILSKVDQELDVAVVLCTYLMPADNGPLDHDDDQYVTHDLIDGDAEGVLNELLVEDERVVLLGGAP